VFIARQDLSAQQAEAIADHFAKVIEDQGGQVPKREYWGLRGLAYRIRKNRKGHYTMFNIDAPPAAIAEIDRQMRINEDIIRHMTVRVEKLVEGPSAVLLSRARGDDRERPRGERGDRDRGDRDRGDRGDRDRGDRGDRDRGDRGDRGDRDRGPRERYRSFGDGEPRPASAAAVSADESEGERS
jgi:small subunit ribosomal protein S6